jgi:hypothetical protein
LAKHSGQSSTGAAQLAKMVRGTPGPLAVLAVLVVLGVLDVRRAGPFCGGRPLAFSFVLVVNVLVFNVLVLVLVLVLSLPLTTSPSTTSGGTSLLEDEMEGRRALFAPLDDEDEDEDEDEDMMMMTMATSHRTRGPRTLCQTRWKSCHCPPFHFPFPCRSPALPAIPALLFMNRRRRHRRGT